MSIEVDSIVDRRRLRRRLTFWRVFALIAAVAAIGALAFAYGGKNFTSAASAHVARVNIGGLIRNDTPGTYYLFLYAPRNRVGTPITARSTITALVETPIVLGTQTDPQTSNAFNSNPFHYDAGTEQPWQVVNATGTGTGNLNVGFFAANTPGRFDNLAVRTGGGTGTADTVGPSVVPLFGNLFAANGSTPIAHIFKNPVSAELPNQTEFFVQVRPTTTAGASRRFQLEIQPQTFHNFGMLASGSTTMVTDEPLTSAIPERRYYFEAPPNSTVTITVAPDSATLDPTLVFVENDEAEHRVIDDGIVNQPETTTYTVTASGYGAFIVRGGLVVTDQSFTVTLQVDPPAYSVTSGSTPFSDICSTGTVHPAGGIFGDEGFTAAIPTVEDFDFFGAGAAAQFRVSTNGFITFDPGAVNPNYFPAPIPDEVGEASIAPLWNDLWLVQICSKVEGTKQIVQWEGEDFNTGDLAQMQAILDGADDSIEFVYGTGQSAIGTEGTRGVQDLGGLTGFGMGAFGDFVTPGSSVKLTPTP